MSLKSNPRPCLAPACPRLARFVGSGLCGVHDEQRRLVDRGTCVVPGCDRPIRLVGSGLCGRDDMRRRIYGSTDDPRPPAETRFWGKIQKTEHCWLWTTGTDEDGYGVWWYKGGARRAHRYSYELLEPIPEGLHIDHLCRVTRCVRPAHLEPVTAAENQRRARTPNPNPCGCWDRYLASSSNSDSASMTKSSVSL